MSRGTPTCLPIAYHVLDMEAFKAANPGCVLEDFIRWHSPKDWVEDKGQMSARMADAGNYWQELWAVRHTLLFLMINFCVLGVS